MTENETAELLKRITKDLLTLGEISVPYKIEKHSHQGYMSQVFILSSAKGELVVHIAKPFKHHFTYKTWEKLKVINTLVAKETKLPVSRMILAEPVDDIFITVQTKLPGVIAGSRAILGHSIVDTWLQDKNSLMHHLQKIVAEIHSLEVRGFGLVKEKDGKPEGAYPAWKDFFIEESPLWLESLKKLEQGGLFYDEMTVYTKKFCDLIPVSSPSLIHGDLGNPTNILVENNRIIGIIDWEWSIIGDPAWEFCDPGWGKTIAEVGLATYFRERNIQGIGEKEAFLKWIILYRPLWSLWEAYIHRENKDTIIYQTLRMLMEKDLIEARKYIDNK